MSKVLVFDPTANDPQSKVRGVGRYLQILRENFPTWIFTNNLTIQQFNNKTVFVNPFFNLLSPPFFTKRRFQKQIAIIHDLIPLKYPSHFPIGLKGSLNVFLNKIALRSYDIVITDSEQSKKDIITILEIKPERVKVIYPCLPTIYNSESIIQNSNIKILNYKFNSEFSTLNSKFLLYVGDATWNKNLVNLAKAIKLQELPCVFVGKVFDMVNGLKGSRVKELSIVAGDESLNFKKIFRQAPQNKWLKEFNEFVKIAQNDKRFIFPGFISDEELIQIYQNAVCNIFISRDEGFGFSYVEASSQKCPSLLSDISILREISQDCAVFVDPENPQEIANQIKTLGMDNNIRTKLVEKAYQRSQFFSQNNFVDGFNSIV